MFRGCHRAAKYYLAPSEGGNPDANRGRVNLEGDAGDGQPSDSFVERPATEVSPRGLVPVPGIPERVWRNLHASKDEARVDAILRSDWVGRVLEVGAGRGFVACLISRSGGSRFVATVDADEKYATQTRDLARANSLRLGALAGQGERLPFAPRSFDRVLLSEVLEHVHDPAPILRDLRRVLAWTGRALVTVPMHGALPPAKVPGHVQDFAREEITKLIEGAGLVIERLEAVAVYEFFRVRRNRLWFLGGARLRSTRDRGCHAISTVWSRRYTARRLLRGLARRAGRMKRGLHR